MDRFINNNDLLTKCVCALLIVVGIFLALELFRFLIHLLTKRKVYWIFLTIVGIGVLILQFYFKVDVFGKIEEVLKNLIEWGGAIIKEMNIK